jgi:hypothetical protein
MELAEHFARLADEVRNAPYCLMSEVTFFPSGAVSMRVRVNTTRALDLDFSSDTNAFSVGDLPEAAGFNTGYDSRYVDFQSARRALLKLLAREVKEN